MEICIACYKFFDESIKALVRGAEWCRRSANKVLKNALEQDKLVPVYDARECFRFKGYYNDHYEVIDDVLVKKPESKPPRRPPVAVIAIGAAVVGIVLRNMSANKKAVKRNGCPCRG